jgi:hypothetical protein
MLPLPPGIAHDITEDHQRTLRHEMADRRLAASTPTRPDSARRDADDRPSLGLQLRHLVTTIPLIGAWLTHS